MSSEGISCNELAELGQERFNSKDHDKEFDIPGYIWKGSDSLVLKRHDRAIHVYNDNITLAQINLLNQAINYAGRVLSGRTVSFDVLRKLLVQVTPIEQIYQHPNGRIITVSPFIEGKMVSRITNKRQ